MGEIALIHTLKSKNMRKYFTEHVKYHFNQIDNIDWIDDKVLFEYSNGLSKEDIDYLVLLLEKTSNTERFNYKRPLDIDGNTSLFRDYFKEEFSSLYLKEFKENKDILESIKFSYSGTNIFIGEIYELRNELNKILSKAANTFFKAQSLSAPSLLSKSEAKRLGYFHTGAQHMYFINEVRKDPKNYSLYTKSVESDNINNLDNYLINTNYVLTPAVCLHIYPLLEDRKMSKPECFDINGQVFRDEGGNVNSTNRFNEFNVHEIVFVGNKQDLESIHQQLLLFMYSFLKELSILSHLEYSNDIFFGSNSDSQLLSQLFNNSKIEAIDLNLGVSLASLNRHNSHFCKEYNIKDNSNDEYIESICLGFGIDRIIKSLLKNLK